MRGLAATLRAGHTFPAQRAFTSLALLGDLVANSVYYSLVGVGSIDHPWRRGTLLGLLSNQTSPQRAYRWKKISAGDPMSAAESI